MTSDKSEDNKFSSNTVWEDLPVESRKCAVEILVQMIYKVILAERDGELIENDERSKKEPNS